MSAKLGNLRAETGEALRDSRQGSLIGRNLLGRYRVVRELARGGMGVVYLARVEGASGFVKQVVIKLLLPQYTTDERSLGMFIREAQILAELRHPNIVPVLDFGEDDGAYVMVLEYVRGYHIGQWARYAQKQRRAIPAELLMLLLLDVLEALHKVHGMKHPDGSSMHIVHRDVSPSNILLDEDGRARLLDFGVARMRGEQVHYETAIQSFVGKFSYGAPELFGGTDASPSSDVYSCAVVLHELLIGHNVFRGPDDSATLNLVLNHNAEAVEPVRPDVPRGLDAVLARALAKEPEKRFASAGEFASALRALLPSAETQLRARVSARLREDFTDAMAEALGIESLLQRDEALRDVQANLEPAEATMMIDLDDEGDEGVTHDAPDPESGIRVGRGPARARAITLSNPVVAPRVPTGSFPRPSVPPPPFVARAPDGALQPRARHVVTVRTDAVAPPLDTGSWPQAKAPGVQRAPVNRMLLWSTVVVGCLAVIAIVLSLVRRPAPPPVVRMVPAQQQADVQQAAAAAAALEEAKLVALRAGRSSALRAHQERIDACFRRKPRSRRGPDEVQLQFQVDGRGKVLDVQIEPPDLARSALGRCLRAVGNSTRFPAQGDAASFSLPVRAEQ